MDKINLMEEEFTDELADLNEEDLPEAQEMLEAGISESIAPCAQALETPRDAMPWSTSTSKSARVLEMPSP